MDLRPYVDNLRDELLVAADAGGEEARALAARLVAPLDSAVRLTLLGALSAAADEITRDLAPGSVDLRLRGLDPGFVVTPPPAEHPPEEPAAPAIDEPPPSHEDGPAARINFRPPEPLKARIEEAAGREGLSVNAWLVRAVTATLNQGTRRDSTGEHHHIGWVR